MLVRELIEGEELHLRQVFCSSIHTHAQGFYTPEQIAAWAPMVFDEEAWSQKVSRLNPYILEDGGRILGYADLQETGLINHFYVAGEAGGRGVGSALMRHLIQMGSLRKLVELHSFVSRSAEGFFAKHGFTVDERRMARIGGVKLAQARMSMVLTGWPSGVDG